MSFEALGRVAWVACRADASRTPEPTRDTGGSSQGPPQEAQSSGKGRSEMENSGLLVAPEAALSFVILGLR